MRKYIWILLMMVSQLGLNALAKEVKKPDSYAYNRGVEAFSEDNYQDAIDWFNKELKENPDNGFAHLYMGVLRAHFREYGKALTELDAAIKKLPKKENEWRGMAYATRAATYAEMEDTVSALKDFELAIKADPKNHNHYNARAQIYFEQKNYPLADADYDRMIALDPGNVMGYMGKGRNAKVQKRWDEAIVQFNYVIKLAPDYDSGYSFRAEAYIGQEKYIEAVTDIIKALDLSGDEKAMYLMMELPEEAVGLMKSKLKIQSAKQATNPFWLYYLGLLTMENKEYQEAIGYFEQGHKLDADAIFPEYIAKAYNHLKQYEKALSYADQALAMSPEEYEVIKLRAEILNSLGRLDESIEEWDKILAHDPEDVLAYLSRAEVLMDTRRYDDAIEDYNMAAVLVPMLNDYPRILMRRGDAYRLTGRNELAAIDYNNLIAAEKDSTLNTDSYTPFAYSGLGEGDKAVETMQYIVDNNPDDKLTNLYQLACVYARVGRNEDAVKALKAAVDEGYDNISHIEVDYDLDGIRNIPEFVSLLETMKESVKTETEAGAPGEEAGVYEVVEIPFTKDSGVTRVQCTINGLPLHFVFDTGASDVTISMVEANFMLKNDYIKPSDIIGTARYMTADGNINEGTVINLKKVDFGGLELDNVRASVVRNQQAPLLLGQSVLGRLGKIEIDNVESKLKITHRK